MPRLSIEDLREWAKQEIERSRRSHQGTQSAERILRDLTNLKLRAEIRARKRKAA